MQTLRISRWRQPRLNWVAIVLLITGYLSFGALASVLHAQPEPPAIVTNTTTTADR